MTISIWGNIVRGVAFGDAWGDPNEFKSIAMLTKGNHGLGPDLPERLRITDDTQMTLYLAKALNDTWGQEPAVVRAAIANEFLAYRSDPESMSRAPGSTVMGSLYRLLPNGINWKYATSPGSDGSGTVMRTSACAFLPEDRWVGVTAFAAAITHGTANAIAAAILNVAMLRNIMARNVSAGNLLGYASYLASNPQDMGLLDTGEWLEGYQVDLSKGFEFLAGLIDAAIAALPDLMAEPWGPKSDPSLVPGLRDAPMRGGGWRSPHALVIAMLSIDMFSDEDYQPMGALRRSVTTDGDSDTIGAVAGGLLGALHPPEFIEAWAEDSDRFEQIYVDWITEADGYHMADEAVTA